MLSNVGEVISVRDVVEDTIHNFKPAYQVPWPSPCPVSASCSALLCFACRCCSSLPALALRRIGCRAPLLLLPGLTVVASCSLTRW
jgi:hypothetical protein